MNEDTLKGKWNQLAGKVKSAWGDLTDDEITQIEGDSQRLSGLIQERYGRTKEQADKEVDDFVRRY